jgi:protocatechuate 3,4-dioxygenase beta subunit
MAKLNRREALSILAVTAAGGALVPRSAFAQDANLMDADLCVIVPEVTEGPYYFDPALERMDITEGRPGLPLKLQMQVVDQACAPLPGSRVDVWHCDADGIYSGYNGYEGETFMRGTQFANADGMVEFVTVYPGWYRGRTTHIHFKVFLDETTVLTGQIFFPDEVSEQVYASVEPYTARPNRDTFNDEDNIARQAGTASIATVDAVPDRYTAALIVGVDPGAVSEGGFGGLGAPGGPPTDGAMSFPPTEG